MEDGTRTMFERLDQGDGLGARPTGVAEPRARVVETRARVHHLLISFLLCTVSKSILRSPRSFRKIPSNTEALASLHDRSSSPLPALPQTPLPPQNDHPFQKRYGKDPFGIRERYYILNHTAECRDAGLHRRSTPPTIAPSPNIPYSMSTSLEKTLPTRRYVGHFKV